MKWVYILKCADGSYYTGRTANIELRLAQHQNGQGSAWTRTRLPVRLAFSVELPDEETAYIMEWKVKKWSRAKKEALIAGDFDLLRYLAKKPRYRK